MFRVIHPNRWFIWTLVILLIVGIVVMYFVKMYEIEQEFLYSEGQISYEFLLLRRDRGSSNDLVYHNAKYGVEFKYPGEWRSTLNQPNSIDTYVIFYTDNRDKGLLTLDLTCTFATGFEDVIKSETEEMQMNIGGVQATSLKLFSLDSGSREFLLHTIKIPYPEANKQNANCTNAMFVLSEELSSKDLGTITSSFKFTAPLR